METEFQNDKISQEEVSDFLKFRKMSERLKVKIEKLQASEETLSKIAALELILDFEENN